MNSRSLAPLRPYAVLVTVGMSFLILMKVIVVATDIWALKVFGNLDANLFFYPTASSLEGEISRLDRWLLFTSIADALFFIYTAVVFIVWMRHAYRNIMQPDIVDLRYSRGWTIGAFLIPLANVVLPYLVMREIWQCSSALSRIPIEGNWQMEKQPLPLRLWWPLTIAGFLIMDFSEQIAHFIPRADTVVFAVWLHIGGVLLYLFAVALTLKVVWGLTDMQWRMLVNARKSETLTT